MKRVITLGKYDRENELSTSQMTSYQRCKRQWYLQYHRQLQYKDGDNKPVNVGNLVHKALETFYSPGDRRDPVDVMDEMLDGLVKSDSANADAITKHGELARVMFLSYKNWLEETHYDDYLEIVASEAKITAPLEGTRWTLSARIDARGRRMGSRVVIDHKTVDSFDQIPKTGQINHQFLTYHLVEYLQDDPSPIDCVLINMARRVDSTHKAAKPPFFDRYEIRYNIEELRNHWRHVFALSQEISDSIRRLDEGESHQTVCPPSPRRDCDRCPFRTVCSMMDDGSNYEGFIKLMFPGEEDRDGGTRKAMEAKAVPF